MIHGIFRINPNNFNVVLLSLLKGRRRPGEVRSLTLSWIVED
jgi:hypothetical protein